MKGNGGYKHEIVYGSIADKYDVVDDYVIS